MPSWSYIGAVLAIGFGITLALRAVPFAVLASLREADFVARMEKWMPVGIMGILAASTFFSSAGPNNDRLVPGLVAVAITILVHLLCGRRTLLSVGAGTLAFVGLVALI